ncbi:hypothetical protein A0H76_2406 [Hepatospora eriocheir]|uniref:Golgi protein n=2 Tax=Hepatospora eriocheir TaxID=1081669 RepID=A0A1X0QFJ0_9MICR|nr:hypothetical protein A0H76_2406 [Hepatospora eriocheir]
MNSYERPSDSAVNGTNLYKEVLKYDTTIKIIGAPGSGSTTNQIEIDEIDANEFETFTLEELKVLVINYRKKDKDFLLARVTTPDPENRNLFYNFYYSASEINRVLFRQESNRRLLHRMKVKNPLNNMQIIGQVYYYKVACIEIDSAIADFFGNPRPIETAPMKKSFSEVTRSTNTFSNIETTRSIKSKDCLDINRVELKGGLTGTEFLESVKRGIKDYKEPDENRKMIYNARYFATDDDFLLKSGIRDYFRCNAIDPNDDFLYEINRTQNDFLALLDEDSESEDIDVGDWRRIFTTHVSLGFSMLLICLLIGGGPIIAVIFFPLALLIVGSFIFSFVYVLCCRRSTFDTQAVESFSSEVL